MTDTELAPGIGAPTLERLGDRAYPARGRSPVSRYVFSICLLEDLEQTKAGGALRLEHTTGPLRCTPIDHTAAIGRQDAADLLATLSAAGISNATLDPVVHAFGTLTAATQHLGAGPAVLLVTSCGALTGQARAAVPFS